MPSWNQWYNPLDNLSAGLKSVAGGFAAMGGGQYGGGYAQQAQSEGEKAFNKTPSADAVPKTKSGVAGAVVNNLKSNLKTNFANDQSTNDSYDSSAYNGYGGYGGGSSAPAYSQDDINYLNDQLSRLNKQYGRTDTTLAQGLDKILQSYNKERNAANTKQSDFLSDIATERSDTERKKDRAIDKVDTNARTLNDSLRRILGMAGGADSSAYRFAAPNAVARQASEQRGGVVEDYGINFRNLDTTEKRGKRDFETLLESLADQKRTATQDFRAGIVDQRNSIDENRAEIERQKQLALGGGYDAVRKAVAPYVQQIDSRNARIDELLGNIPKYQVNPVKVDMPNLKDYMVDRAAIQANQAAQMNDPYSPYRPQLRDEEERILV